MRTIFCLIAALFFAAPALANTIKHSEAGVQITVPDTWKTEVQGEIVQSESPDEAVLAMFIGVPKAEFEAALDELDKTLAEAGVKDFEGEEPVEGEIDGMPVFIADGTAVVEGQKVELAIFLALPPKCDRALIMLGVSELGAADTHAKALSKMLMSIKPL